MTKKRIKIDHDYMKDLQTKLDATNIVLPSGMFVCKGCGKLVYPKLYPSGVSTTFLECWSCNDDD